MTKLRTRRSDYIIRKQADYGTRRWSIHYRKPVYGEPYQIARTDTREQARELVDFLMNVDRDRYTATLMMIRKVNQ
jgi:hypothetical protein